MRWKHEDKQDGWVQRLAILPTEIGGVWVWLEFYWAKDMLEYTNVRLLEDKPF